MESLVFGHAGQPILVFPTSMGSFFEYEDAGMIRALGGKLEAGAIQVFCVDGVMARAGTTRACIRERGSGGMCSTSAT
jgi:esterase/lipase superfamily enzyme